MKKIFTVLSLVLSPFLVSISLYAQTGPGGVGNAAGSGGQPRNILWLRGGDGVVQSGTVDSWADQSGNGLSATGSGATRPSFVASDGNFNSQPVISFPTGTGGTNEHLVVTDNDILDNTAGLSLFSVFRSATDPIVGADRAILSKRTSSGVNQSYMMWINTNDLTSRISGTTITPGNNNLAGAVTYIGSVVYTGGATPSTSNYLNGAIPAPNGTGGGPGSIPNNASDLFIGAFDNSVGEFRNLEGQIGEVIIYTSTLNVAQRQIVENYLAAKYNLTITGDVYSGDGTGFDFNVAGIGRASGTTHTEASSAGFILSTYNGSLDVDGEFLLAGNNGTANSVVNCACAGFPGTIQQRWARTWYVDKTTAGTLDGAITFDFGDGIGGQFPQNKDDYELLYSSDGGTNYSVVGVVSGDKVISGDRMTFRVANASLLDGIYTLGTLNSTASPVNGGSNQTWYSYQTGNANDPLVWTLDGGGTPLYVNPSSEVPGGNDNVVITTGKTITVTADNFAVNNLEVIGTMDFGQTSGHITTAISGTGRIRFAGSATNLDNFPTGTTTAFANALTGGTVEIYGSANITLNQARVYNDLIINRTGGTISLTAGHTINGEFTVASGVFQFGGTATSLSVLGDIQVDPGGTISVQSANVRHQFNVYGDFTNNGGTVQFTNRVAANYTAEAADGIVDFNLLNDTEDQDIICNGPTRFYRIEIDKGTDDTYLATFTANAPGNFNLFGYSDINDAPTAQLPTNDNSFGLLFGTAEIGTNISIPVLSNGGNYNVSAGAALWVNGGTVLKNAGNSLVPYGKVRITAGLLEAKVNAGITTRDNGTIIVEGGVVNTNQIRTSVLGASNVGGYVQSGGAVTVDGGGPGGTGLDYYVFSLTYTGNVFQMSGGTLTVKGHRVGTASTRGAIFINSDPANVSVTGGTVIAEISNSTITSPGAYPTNNNTAYKITSRAPFWNLILRNTFDATQREVDLLGGTSGPNGGGASEITLPAQNLIVKGGLTIESNTALDHNGKNINIAGNLTIQSNADLLFSTNVSRRNTTTLDGTDNATLTFLNRTLASAGDEQRFWNFVIDKPSDKVVSLASGKADLSGNNNNLLRIDGDSFKLLSGILDQGFHSVRMYCDTVLNYQTVGIYSATSNSGAVANDRNDLIKLRDDNNPTKFLTLSSSLFGAVRLNSGSDPIGLVSDVRIQYLDYQYGKMNLGSHRLTLDDINTSVSANADSLGLAANKFSVEDMLVTSGNNSDGGLAILIPSNGYYDFPIGLGITADDVANTPGTDKYTPARVRVTNVTDDGYIIINPVQGILQTTNLSGGADILSYYWRVRFEGFSTLPTVRYQFTYNDGDVGGTEANYVSGKVLDVNPFTRSHENNVNKVNDANNVVGFYGSGSGFTGGGAGAGFTLEQANYTAGQPTRFGGAVRVLYTRALADGWNTDWNNTAFWTEGLNGAFGVHDSRQVSAGVSPQAGDIAVIGWVPFGDPAGSNGAPHGIAMNGTQAVAEVRFTQMLDVGNNPTARVYFQNFQFRPTLVLNNNGGVQGQIASGATVSGEGLFWIRSTGGNLSDPAFTGVDLGAFNAQDSSYFIYETTLASATYTNIPSEFPNLMMATDGWGNQDKSSTISKDITVNGDLELLGNINLVLNTGATGNITVNRNLRFFRSNANGNDSGGGGELRYGNTGTARSVTVLGNLILGNGYAALIRVLTPGVTPIVHSFNLHGNFTQNTTGGNGFKAGTVSTQDRISVNLLGNASMTLTNTAGDAPQFYNLVVNKGSSTATVANINANITIDGPTNVASKPLTLTSGLLRLNQASIAITLSSGGGNFSIPAGAGLEVSAGTVSLTGSDTGLLLDGLLRVSGGTVNIDDAVGNGNNFIEYSASGSAILEVTSGTLTVGSQIRRGLTSTAGILKYRQSGGDVVVGRRTAPTTSRGVFEVVNAGSEFTHSAGTLTLVRGINSATVPSLLIEPETPGLTIDPGSTINIGNANTPAGVNGQNIGIKSNRRLGVLTINNSSGNSPRALIYSSPLAINGTFTIATGASFNAQGLDLTLRGNMVASGTFIPSGNLTTFNVAGTNTLSGTGTINFADLAVQGGGVLNVLNNLNISDDLTVGAGTLADNGNTLSLSKNAYFGTSPSTTGTHTSTPGGLGIVFAGTSQQQLFALRTDGLATLGTITINNTNGVIVPDQADKFTIATELRLQSGVLDIGGSLLTLGPAALIEQVNLFSVTNMIQTNSSFTDNGVAKVFPIGTTDDFTFPVGQAYYTPVIFDFADIGPGSGSGSSQATITIRPANERHPIIIEDVESGLCVSQIDDLDNVLQYHWIVTAENTTNFESNVTMQYDQSLVSLGENEYLAAVVLSSDNSVSKFPGNVNSATNIISFQFDDVTEDDISGEYFAGVDCAIPDMIRVYVTKGGGGGDGPATLNTIYVGDPFPLQLSGSVIQVSSGDVVIFESAQDNISLYRTIVDGILEIESGSIGHRLGTVTGTGTISLEVNAPDVGVVLPAGYYTAFLDCAGGGLQFGGNASYEILGGINSLRRLSLTGSGNRTLGNNNIVICEDLTLNGPNFLNSNNRNIIIQRDLLISSGNFSSGIGTLEIDRDLVVSGGTFDGQTGGTKIVDNDLTITSGTFTAGSGGTLNISGDLIYGGGTFSGGSGTHKTVFQGSSAQVTAGVFSLNRLEINNGTGLTLGGNTTVTNELLLTNGNITPSGTFTLTSPAFVTPTDGKSTSFVNGRLHKVLPQGASFVFPIGKGTRWRRGSVISPTSATTTTWEFEHFPFSALTTSPLVTNLTPSSSTIKTVSLGEFWRVSTGATPNTATIGLSWGIESDVSANSVERQDLVVLLWNDGTSLWDSRGGTNFSSGNTQSDGSFNASSVISFSEQVVTLGSLDVANPLPVTFLEFTGKTEGRLNVLSWSTAMEKNNDYFELERSTDGELFELVGKLAGSGTVSTRSRYTLTDFDAPSGRSYYRLKQVDYDGAFAYHPKIVVLTLEENNSLLDFEVFPNPTAGEDISLRIFKGNNDPVQIRLIDVSGRLVLYTEESFRSFQLKTPDVPQGLYLIEVSQGARRATKRLIIEH